MVKNFKVFKSVEYVCIYCSYIFNNNIRVKKYILLNYEDL